MIQDYLRGYRPTYAQYKASRGRREIPTARVALLNARYDLYRSELLVRWGCAGGETIPECETPARWRPGSPRVRIVEHPDEILRMDDLKGDCFNPDVNSNINPNRLEREESEFEARVRDNGVWGYVAEYWDGTEWCDADSIWGFVGNDFIGSCYDDELMESALAALSGSLEREARAQEASRPDMYALA